MLDALRDYADTLRERLAPFTGGGPEAQLREPVAELIRRIGNTVKVKVTDVAEVHLGAKGVRPDLAIYVDDLTCGYVELKAPGTGADPRAFKGAHNRRQWDRLSLLPNLLLTDGLEWALYRGGKREGPLLRLDAALLEKGAKAVGTGDVQTLQSLLFDFLGWQPVVPHDPRELAAYLAPLTRYLRTEVETALGTEGSEIALLANEWREYFFPEADDAQFADAYAQTVTYALLLARLSDAIDLDPAKAADRLDVSNGVLAQALRLLGQPEARNRLRVGFELLKRSLEALDPHDLAKGKPDLWLYFYEDFLAAYDPKLRKDYGVYYTPREVVRLQVGLAGELRRKRFGKKLAFADQNVVVLDPAVGTGTYLVGVIDHATRAVAEKWGEAQAKARLQAMIGKLYGFEILVGPYAVAHVRVSRAFEEAGATVHGRLKIYLADTLESPEAEPPKLTLTYKALTDEHEAARRLKNEGEILVCLGNPPYDRHEAGKGGGWVRYGDQEPGAADQKKQERPILDDFVEPAQKAGQGGHLKNLYNLYVYFWRWALWRLFEKQNCGGILTFITAASYLAGPGFVGMRERMRRTFDELWILDLGGDNLGTRKTPNVFAIQIPVAIAIGVRGPEPDPDTPAKVRYARIDAPTPDAKLEALAKIVSLDDVEWRDCPSNWSDPFLPRGQGDYFTWPALTDIFPWQHSGLQFKRTWPIGESRDVLKRRLKELLSAKSENRASLLRATKDRHLDYSGVDLFIGKPLPPLRLALPSDSMPTIAGYGHRSFDRKFAIYDSRFCDRPRPELVATCSQQQIYMIGLFTKVLGRGPALVASAFLPDLDFFCNRGAKDVIALWRDHGATVPNVASGLLDRLEDCLGRQVSAADVAAYVYGLLGTSAYTERFWHELETPGPRIPITRDPELFDRVVEVGRYLLWLHSFAERFQDLGAGRGDEVPQGRAHLKEPIPVAPAALPNEYKYDPDKCELRVGKGIICDVAPEVWGFEVSGLRVLDSWLGHRMRERRGRKSAPLDDIRPEHWEPWMTEELLRVIWILEGTLECTPKARELLERVVRGPRFRADELPAPSKAERRPPKTKIAVSAQHKLL